jgi:hypothetical protein
MKTALKLFLLAAALLAGLPHSADAASSVSRHGVTWTFDRDYATGQYCNGDWWVQGPVVITSITPTPTTGRNGTVINPSLGSTQGYDDRWGNNPYNHALNKGASLPLSVGANSSVVSSISKTDYIQYGQIEAYVVLTVVASIPPAGAFRPPYIGNGSRASLWKSSDLNYGVLNSLSSAALTSRPNLTTVAGYFDKTWYEQDLNWTGRRMHTAYMADNGYGQDMAVRTGDAALLLQLDYPNAQKEALLIRYVQYGIDIYGILLNGGSWYADGGHNCGRFSPLLVAAAVLNDSGMKTRLAGPSMNFQELQQTFTVTQVDVNLTARIGTNGDPVYQYAFADIGMAEWGIRHASSPEKDNNYWGASYRDIGGSILTAPAMAARVMGARAMVAWEPLFLYQERHLNYEQGSSYGGEFNSNATPTFHKQFYNAHKNAVPRSGVNPIEPPPPPPPLPVAFALGDRIQITKNTNVRVSGALTATLLGVQVAYSEGTLVGGPTGPDANNITWWQVDFDTGVDGWTGQDNYIKSAADKPRIPMWMGAE